MPAGALDVTNRHGAKRWEPLSWIVEILSTPSSYERSNRTEYKMERSKMNPFLRLSEAHCISIKLASDKDCLTRIRYGSASANLIKFRKDEIAIDFAVTKSEHPRYPQPTRHFGQDGGNKVCWGLNCKVNSGCIDQVRLEETRLGMGYFEDEIVKEIPNGRAQSCERCRVLKVPVEISLYRNELMK